MFQKVSDELEDKSGDIEDQAEALLIEKIEAQGAKAFVAMLRTQTQEPLDWIKVNGVCWGFLIGSIAGGMAFCLSHPSFFGL